MPDSVNYNYIYITRENKDRVVRIFQYLIKRKRARWLRLILEHIHAASLADIWEFFDDIEKDIIISMLDVENSADLLSELEKHERIEILEQKNYKWLAERVEELDPDDAVDILKDLQDDDAQHVLKHFDLEYSQKIKELMQYPEETAGALMSSDFITAYASATVDSIIKSFQKVAKEDDLEDYHFVYVVDKKNQLMGYIPIRKLILESPKKKAKDIMKEVDIAVHHRMDQEEVARIFRDYNLLALPVVDDDGILVGKITIDDVVDVIEREASEDAYRLVGLNKQERISNSIITSFRHRFPWMMINLLTTSLGAIVVGLFQGVLEQYVLLAVFMPMVAALGGATGNQMVTMIVRGLAIGELHFRQVRWILFREIIAVAAGALVIGLLVAMGTLFFQKGISLGLVVALALLLNMVFATIVGAGIPLALRFFKQDPAFGSSILVSASTDILGFFIFLWLAGHILLDHGIS